jgi:putative hemolysin
MASLPRQKLLSFQHDEGELIQRVFRFTDRLVSAVMTPRSNIIAVTVGTTRTEVLQTFARAGHSRLPVYEDSLATW